MSWFRLDDKFHSNQKVIAARNAAVGLYVRCGTWSADQGTEGRIPSHVALMFGTKAEIARVSAAGLWQPTDYGYLIRFFASLVAVSVLLVWRTVFALTRPHGEVSAPPM